MHKSDHDAQLITLNNFSLPFSNTEPSYTRNINKNTTTEFQLQLSWKRWYNIFGNNNVNDMFNNFLNTYLRCYYSSFLKKEIKSNATQNQWMTEGIKIACKRRNFFYCVDAVMI